MASIRLPAGSPTLSTWALAFREAAERGTVTQEFAHITRADVVAGARLRGIEPREGRIFEGYQGAVYFGLREHLTGRTQ